MHKVLLVDDEPGSIKTMKYLLNWQEHGFVIAGEAENGMQALEQLKIQDYTLLITDIRMPGLSGLELLAEIRLFSNIPIVVMSGYEDFHYAKECLRYGVKDYLLKPVGAEEVEPLLASLRQEIERFSTAEKKLPSQSCKQPQPPQLIQVLKKLVEDQYKDNNLSLKAISEQLYVNAAYLGQLFKGSEGMTFNDYLLKLRMEKAKELLDATPMKVYEVAQEVGYSDLNWFYKKFKEYVGVSTSEYRAE